MLLIIFGTAILVNIFSYVFAGDFSAGGPPGPIPTPAVKPSRADDTASLVGK